MNELVELREANSHFEIALESSKKRFEMQERELKLAKAEKGVVQLLMK